MFAKLNIKLFFVISVLAHVIFIWVLIYLYNQNNNTMYAISVNLENANKPVEYNTKNTETTKTKTKIENKEQRINVAQTYTNYTDSATDYTLPSNPPPIYPMVARIKKQSGTVIVNTKIINKKPINTYIKQSSGYTNLDNEALKTVKSWSFTKDTNSLDIPIIFQLEKR